MSFNVFFSLKVYKDSTLTTPRISMSNIAKANEKKQGRYNLQGTKWNKTVRTYLISSHVQSVRSKIHLLS